MNNEFDWTNYGPAAQTSDEFHALEHPKPRYLYDELTPVADLPHPMFNPENYPEIHETWTPKAVTQ